MCVCPQFPLSLVAPADESAIPYLQQQLGLHGFTSSHQLVTATMTPVHPISLFPEALAMDSLPPAAAVLTELR